ncbi:MAG: glycosyltransferase family 4 protein [Bryobacteraceae bacterium]
MKIAFVVHDFNRTWGHSRYVAELSERFAQHHEVHVYANTVIADERVSRVHFHKVPACRKNAFSTVLSFIVPATVGIREKFDIIHSQGFCGLKYDVITAHQCSQEWYNSRCKSEKRLPLKEHVMGIVISFLEGQLYARARTAHVIAVSNRIKEDLLRNYGSQAPINVIHHGVDFEQFSPNTTPGIRSGVRGSWGVELGRFVFLYVGNLQKGATQCILAMKQFPEARLVLISRSDPTGWQKLAEENGVSDRVILAGQNEQVEQAFASADAFLMPTPYDPFGLVITEAMSCGLPSVVSREAGASELVKPGLNGLILEDVKDVEELAGHMRMLYSDREFARGLGKEARKTAESRSWDEVATQTMNVYQTYIESRRKIVPAELQCR